MKTELQAGKEAKKRQQGLWFTGGLSVWVFFGKWMAILKRTKTDLTSEGNQFFLHSMSQNKSCQNLFRKNNRIELSMRPWAGSDSVQSAGVGLANTYQTTWHPSASSGEIPCWRMTALERGSTEFNPVPLAEHTFYSSAYICMGRAINGDCNEGTHLQNLICGSIWEIYSILTAKHIRMWS